MLYDTGAMMTLMNRALLTRLSIPGVQKKEREALVSSVQGVTGSQDVKILKSVTFHVLVSENPDRWVKVTDDISVSYGVEVSTSNLLGVSAIRQLNMLKVKFVQL